MRAVVFDTETTDLLGNVNLPIDKQPNIIEFCGIKIELCEDQITWKEVGVLDYLVKPPHPIDPKITKITGIDNEMVNNEPPISARLKETEEFFADADMVVAHNLTFDIGILHNEAMRLGNRKFVFPDIRICTVEVTEPFFGRRMNLNDLHEHLFEERFKDAHRARHDVEATVRVFCELWALDEI